MFQRPDLMLNVLKIPQAMSIPFSKFPVAFHQLPVFHHGMFPQIFPQSGP